MSFNVFFDVDNTLVVNQDRGVELRPHVPEAFSLLKDLGCSVYLWSRGGKEYADQVADMFNLRGVVEGSFEKPPRNYKTEYLSTYLPAKPDFIVDDGDVVLYMAPSYMLKPYLYPDSEDVEMLRVVEIITGILALQE